MESTTGRRSAAGFALLLSMVFMSDAQEPAVVATVRDSQGTLTRLSTVVYSSSKIGVGFTGGWFSPEIEYLRQVKRLKPYSYRFVFRDGLEVIGSIDYNLPPENHTLVGRTIAGTRFSLDWLDVSEFNAVNEFRLVEEGSDLTGVRLFGHPPGFQASVTLHPPKDCGYTEVTPTPRQDLTLSEVHMAYSRIHSAGTYHVVDATTLSVHLPDEREAEVPFGSLDTIQLKRQLPEKAHSPGRSSIWVT